MHACMYAYMYACMLVYTHACVCTNAHAHVHTRTNTHTYLPFIYQISRLRIDLDRQLHNHFHEPLRMERAAPAVYKRGDPVPTYKHLCKHIHTHTHIYAHTFMHTHTHTHTHTKHTHTEICVNVCVNVCVCVCAKDLHIRTGRWSVHKQMTWCVCVSVCARHTVTGPLPGPPVMDMVS